jgi:hypothetical protein
MEKTMSRTVARRRLLEAQHDAAAARERRERANLTDLTEFTVRMAQVDEVDDWFVGRVEKLKDKAQRKRLSHRSAAGKALHAMRLRGETMASISATTGLRVSRLRELTKYASADHRQSPVRTGQAPRWCRCPTARHQRLLTMHAAMPRWAPNSERGGRCWATLRSPLTGAPTGCARFGPSPGEVCLAETEAKIRTHLRGYYKIGVLGKGGVGKTSVPVSVGSLYAELCPHDRVVAVDADTALSKVGARVDPNTRGSYWNLNGDQHLRTLFDIRSRLGSNEAGLFVLAWESNRRSAPRPGPSPPSSLVHQSGAPGSSHRGAL